MNCPRCQAENRDERRFCAQCGAPLPLVCPSCGFGNASGEKFCGGCGTALAAGKPVPPVQVQTPQHLAQRILTSKRALEGERKQVTVLFADLKSSLELLADRDPEEARELLDAVVTRMIDAVHRYEGIVNQVMGDGIMALFGAPLALEEHAVRACSAALAMQETIARYVEESGASVAIRVGLNSGEVVVRAISSALHMDYTAIGQTTHLAARMEQLATPGSIRMTAETLRLAEGYVQARPLGPVAVKGLREPLAVFELVGMAPARTRLQVSAARGLTPFVGRATERELLPRVLDRAGAGQGQVLAVVGEPGVGKSRLFWEFTQSPRTTDWLVLESRSTSHGKATPYFPLIDLLKVYFGVEERDEPAKIREKVEGRLLALGDALESATSPVLALLGVPVDDPQWEAIEPATRRRRVMESIRSLLVEQSRLQPLLLIFEDLQWIDSETQTLLDMLVEQLVGARMALCVNYRPGYQHGWGAHPHYTELRIDPLAPESAEELLLALLGAAPELEPLARTLIERTQGNPFFIEESVRALAETGALAGERGAYRLTAPVAALDIPPTVQAILAARIDRLSAEEKDVLQSASVIGKDVPFVLLQTIAEVGEHELRGVLGRLQAAEFLYETSLFPDLEHTFKHALTHDVAYRSLLNERRRMLHGRIVTALESLPPHRHANDHVERLAHHAFRAERWEHAVTYLRQAGAKAQRASAHREAVGWLEQALEALGRLPESPTTMEQEVDVRIELRGSLYPVGELERMREYLDRARALADRLGDPRRTGWVSMHIGEYFRQTGHFQQACRLIEQAQDAAEKIQDVPLRLASHHYLALAHHVLGDYRRAANLLLSVGEAWSRQRDYAPGTFGGAVTGRGAGTLAINLAWQARCLAECGDFAEGLDYGRQGLALAEELGSPYSLAATTYALGHLHVVKGDLAEATSLLERALATARESRIALYEAHALRDLGLAYALSGRVAAGLELLEQCLGMVEAKSILLQHATIVGWLGEGLLLAGRSAEARSVAGRALALARERGQRGDEATALRLLGDIAAHDGLAHRHEAEGAYREALARGAELEMRPLVARVHLGHGRLCALAGDRANAIEHLIAATTMLADMDMRPWALDALRALIPLGRILVSPTAPELHDYLVRILPPGEHDRITLHHPAEDPTPSDPRRPPGWRLAIDD